MRTTSTLSYWPRRSSMCSPKVVNVNSVSTRLQRLWGCKSKTDSDNWESGTLQTLSLLIVSLMPDFSPRDVLCLLWRNDALHGFGFWSSTCTFFNILRSSNNNIWLPLGYNTDPDHQKKKSSFLKFSNTFYPQILSNNDCRLLSNRDRRTVCGRTHVFRDYAQVYQIIYYSEGLERRNLFYTPATLRFCIPYTLRRSSTTPPWSRGFMAQVPHWKELLD